MTQPYGIPYTVNGWGDGFNPRDLDDPQTRSRQIDA